MISYEAINTVASPDAEPIYMTCYKSIFTMMALVLYVTALRRELVISA